MGVLDLPAPLLQWADSQMTMLPTLLRVIVWGTVAGLASMWLYRLISPQERIARGKQAQLDARRSLDEFDGELSEAWPLLRRLLSVSLAQVGRVAVPAVVASIPVLFVLVWLSTAYGHAFPESRAPALRITPATLDAAWSASQDGPQIRVWDESGGTSFAVRVAAPVTVIEHRRWWNMLIGNPAGYLEPGSPAQRIEIVLPRRQLLEVGPRWMRGWELPFFAALIAASLLLKRMLRIQ